VRAPEHALGAQRRIGSPLWLVGVLAALCLLYLASALLIPIHQDYPIVDEPIYAEPALDYSESGVVEISEFSAPNAVVETVLGGLLARLIADDIGVLRLASMLVTVASVPFMYVLCRGLGASRHLAVLGSAVYLFTPLAFTLTHVFHTDPFANSLLVIAAASLVAVTARWRHPMYWLMVGSCAMAVGFLSRPQMLMVPAVALFAWLRWGDRHRRFVGALLLVLPTVLVVIGHTLWITDVGEPFIRSLSRRDLFDRSVGNMLKVGAETALSAGIYVGLSVLPLTPLLPLRWRSLFEGDTRRMAIYLAAGFLAMGVALSAAGIGPFDLQAWVSHSGLGGVDRSHLGSRPELPFFALVVITFLLYFTTYRLAMRVTQKWKSSPNPLGLKFILVLAAGFVAAVSISSLPLHAHVLDRYWLPLVPLSTAIGVSFAATHRLRASLAWIITIALAALSFVGTYDSFVAYREVNEYAKELIDEGVDPLSLDAGASWAGAYFGPQDEDPIKGIRRLGPYWVRFYAVDSNPTQGIALSAVAGYEIIERRSYESWLHPGTQYLYLVRSRPGQPFYLDPNDL